MKKFLPALIALALVIGAMLPWALQQNGMAAELKPMNRSQVMQALGEAKGKVVVLNFWASWCGPCRMELPDLVRLRDAYPAETLQIIGLSVDQNPGDAAKAMAKNRINYPVYLATEDAAQAFGVNAIPKTIVFSPTGELAGAREGLISFDELKAVVNKLSGTR